MAFKDYWEFLCPLAIEKGFNVALEPNMAESPSYLSFYNEEGDPVSFHAVFNCPEDFGEEGPHIAVRIFDQDKTTKDYSKLILNKVTVEKGAEKKWVEEITHFKAYVWKPMAYDLATADWNSIPRAYINAWLNWHLHYLQTMKTLFFHESNGT